MRKIFLYSWVFLTVALASCSSASTTLSEDDMAVFKAAVKGIDVLADFVPCRAVTEREDLFTNICYYCITPASADTVTLHVTVPMGDSIIPLIMGINGDNTAAKVVIDDSTGDMMGRYLSEDAENYIMLTQDIVPTPKIGCVIELQAAVYGNGIVYIPGHEEVKAYAAPDETAEVVTTLMNEEGMVPDAYPCKGMSKGWYELELDNKPAFVKVSDMTWDAMDTF